MLRDKCLYLERCGIGCKLFHGVHPETFLTDFQLFSLGLQWPSFYFRWLNLPSRSFTGCGGGVGGGSSLALRLWGSVLPGCGFGGLARIGGGGARVLNCRVGSVIFPNFLSS